MTLNQIINGNCIEVMKTIKDQSIVEKDVKGRKQGIQAKIWLRKLRVRRFF